jgi:serine/threonine protein kinase
MQVQEFCNGGTLRGAITEGAFTSERLSRRWSPIMSMLAQIANGMHYIHRKRICHGDLNPANILLQVPTPQLLVNFPFQLPSCCLLALGNRSTYGCDVHKHVTPAVCSLLPPGEAFKSRGRHECCLFMLRLSVNMLRSKMFGCRVLCPVVQSPLENSGWTVIRSKPEGTNGSLSKRTR